MKLLGTEKVATPTVAGEVLNVLFVLMCHESGIQALAKDSRCCSCLVSMFQLTSLTTLKVRILRLLVILCRHSPTGYSTVLQALKGVSDRPFGSLAAIFEAQEVDPDLLLGLTLLLETLISSCTWSDQRKMLYSKLEAAGAVTFLRRIYSGSLKTAAAGTDELLVASAAYFFQLCDGTPAVTIAAESALLQTVGASSIETATRPVLDISGGTSINAKTTEDSSDSPNDTGNSDDAKHSERDSQSTFKLLFTEKPHGSHDEATDGTSSGLPAKPVASPSRMSSLDQVLARFRQQTQKLDHATSRKLAGLLEQISTSLSREKDLPSGGIVDHLERSLMQQQETDKHPAAASDAGQAAQQDESEDVKAKRGKFGLFEPSEPNANSSTDHDLDNSKDSHVVVDPKDSPEDDFDRSRRRSNVKLALPLFQSLRKGPGLGATPASTPIATASVRKDAKRPVFPSQPSFYVLEELSPDTTAHTNSSGAAQAESESPPLPQLEITETEPARPMSEHSSSTATNTSKDDLTRFRKLMAMGAPKEAVRAKMRQAGLDPELLEKEPTGFSSPRPSKPENVAVDVTKFRKLLSMGAPMAAVKAKMLQAGLDPDLLDQPEQFTPRSQAQNMPLSSTAAAAAGAIESAGIDISQFQKLLSMGTSLAEVKAKMAQAGLDPTLLDSSSAAISSQPPSSETSSTKVLVKDHPEYIKFFKLLSMGAPSAAVKAKILQAGLNPDLLDTPEAEMPTKQIGNDATIVSTSDECVSLPSTSPPLKVKDDPNYSKFFKLLSMGAPSESVKAKMKMAGLDPALLDTPDELMAKFPNGSMPDVSAPAGKVMDDPNYSKFFKLLSMGAPAESVKAKMKMAGLNPDLLDTPNAPVTGATSGTTPSVSTTAVKVKDDPNYAKFFKLLSMGAPAASVKAKMQMAGLVPDLLDTPDALLPGSDAASAPTAPVKVKDDPNYAKFFKLLSMGAPAESVKAKIQMAGLNPDLLDTPDAFVPAPADSNTQTATKAPVKVKDDPEYAKFFKLLAMNAPSESVKAKMRMAGLNADLLDTPEAFVPSPVIATAPSVKVKDDPEYAKYFKLLAMNAPSESIKSKMRMAGLNADLLDTPDAILPSQGSSSTGSNTLQKLPPAPGSRRAHLALAIPPPVKQLTRPFYWQHLRGDAIKDTIWEDIERQGSNQNNEDMYLLADADLALLESEFPPPSKEGPMTGGRQRSGSMDMGPMSPGAPGSPLGSPRVVFLIDRSRANNISIIVKQFRISNAALREAIMKVDTNILNLERVQGLIKILPTEEEIAAINNFQGEVSTLNEAERILKELMTVPRLKQRLASMLAKLQFPGLVRDLEEKVAKVRNASTEIAESAEFRSVLKLILQVGNKMNNGTNRGNAKGFRLNNLPKLAQLKSIDRSVTLLHYVARMLRQKKGSIVHLSDSLGSLYDVQNVPIPELQGDMNKVSEVIDTVGAELTAQQLKNSIEEKESGDAFVSVMSAFLETALTTTSALKDNLEQTMRQLQATMKRFDKDPDDDNPATDDKISPATITGAGEFFNTIYEFSLALSKADRDNEAKRLREEKRLRQQQQKSQIPVRSHSSTDILGRRRGLKTDSETGPEAPESLGKNNASDEPEANDGVQRPARSASMSAIVDGKLAEPAAAVSSPLAAAKTSVTKLMSIAVKPASSGDSSIEKNKSATKKSAKKAAAMADIGKPPQYARSPASGKRDEVQQPQQTKEGKVDKYKKGSPKAILTAPGKIVKSSKQSAIVSPLKGIIAASSPRAMSPLKILTSASSTEKNRVKPLSLEKKVVPFDASSIGEIRSSLETKHGINIGQPSPNHSEPKTSRSSRHASDNNRASSSPEENVSEAETSSLNLRLEIES